MHFFAVLRIVCWLLVCLLFVGHFDGTSLRFRGFSERLVFHANSMDSV